MSEKENVLSEKDQTCSDETTSTSTADTDDQSPNDADAQNDRTVDADADVNAENGIDGKTPQSSTTTRYEYR